MATSYSQVSYGSSGNDVKNLQTLLNNNGYSLTVDGIFGKETQAAVKDYQSKNNLTVDGIVGNNTWGTLTYASPDKSTTDTSDTTGTPASTAFEYEAYTPSDTVTQAETLLNQQLSQKPGEYTSAWQSQLNDTIQKILNREDFSYDLNGDALYQQYKDQYVNQGKLAMMDTMGQAQSMTGGYGNTYAQNAGQQAYQSYLQQLNDVVPELYQLAYDRYNQEGQDLYSQYGLLSTQEEQDYSRYQDQLSAWQTERDYLAGRYDSERDYDYSRYADGRDFAYQQSRDQASDEQWAAEFYEAIRQFDATSNSSSGSGSSGGTSSTLLTVDQVVASIPSWAQNGQMPGYVEYLMKKLLSEGKITKDTYNAALNKLT